MFKFKKIKDLITPKLIYKTALGVSFILVVSVAIVFFLQMQNMNESVDMISDSNKKQFELEKIVSEIILKDNALRSFIITNDNAYLEKDLISKKNVFVSLNYLKEKSSESSFEKIEKISNSIHKQFAIFDEILALSQNKNNDPALLNAKLLESTNHIKRVQSNIYMLLNNEVANLKIHNINHRYEIETSTITAFSLTVITLVILLFSLSKINYDFYKLKKLNQDLKFANQISENAEKVAGISHWKINMKTGKYFFSDNFFRILGIEPSYNDDEVKNVISFIHPDDVEETMKIHNDSLQNLTPTSMIYRIIRPDGEIRFINSIGDFTHNAKGELVKIGVSYDITEQHNGKLILEEKNKSLISINSELESFNQIASHDLQEPLRKIQMFISRIEGSEMNNISEKGKDFFDKIKTSANRMQNLMMDLVNYSRSVKDNKTFTPVNLNEIVEDVMQELSLNIEEKKAKINVDSLPTINAIQFQIHQLFVNLIANSLKYSTENKAPIISIKLSKITENEMINDKIITDKKFYKIIVSDNGIGFKQEFSEKIFILFKRLETEMDYTGTGLGLAICRKIVENHNGFINAEGKQNVGAEFNIYLPK